MPVFKSFADAMRALEVTNTSAPRQPVTREQLTRGLTNQRELITADAQDSARKYYYACKKGAMTLEQLPIADDVNCDPLELLINFQEQEADYE